MDVDPTSRPDEGAGDGLGSPQSEKASLNGDAEVLNHIDQNKQNGYAESADETTKPSASSKHKEHRDKDRHSSSKHSSSSSSGDKKHSSSSSKHGSSSSSSKHHSSSSSSKHRDGHSSSSSHKHSSSSSSSKHRDGHSSSSSSKDKHHSSSSSSKDKDKHRSSSSSGKHSSSSSSKHSSSSSDRHKDKDKDSKHKHSSSSSSKHSSSSSKHKSSKDDTSSKKENVDVQKEKERQERKERERQERKEKEQKERLEKERLQQEQEEEAFVKSEPMSPVKRERSPLKTSPPKHVKVEPESDEEDDDDIPLSERLKFEQEDTKPVKREREESDEDDDVPLSARVEQVKKVKKEKPAKKRKAVYEESEEDEPVVKKKKKAKAAVKQETSVSPKKKAKKGAEEPEVWKWWEEEKKDDGIKWSFLEHRGPVFAPDYEPIPSDVKFYYDGKVMKLSQDTEEVATFYGRMLEHDYTTKEVFNNNFLKDWRKVMTAEEKAKLTDLKKCNFREICDYFKAESEKRKSRSKEEKLKLKEENERLMNEYGYCTMDDHKEKIGNFRIEPPGLFRGRGDHPKQGMLKRRTMPEDVIINCSKDSEIPKAPEGHKWKRVQHDNTVSWLASWNENIQGQTKYVMLNASSRLKGEKDWQKYETARRLHKCVDKIRANYQEDWKSKEMRKRQRSVAMYFIDKLALRAGNEKDEESADTVGCCSLRVEHITLHNEKDDKQNVVEFDFLGKDSIRYQNAVAVEKRVYKNLQMFMDNKQPGDDLFDRLNTVILNKHLHELMEGLTAKVFRTYNASKTLQEQLDIMTNGEDPVAAKMLSYNRANRAVAILCNHQRAAPKNFSKQMETIMAKIKDKRGHVKESKKQLKDAKAAFKSEKTQKNKMIYEKKKKAFERMEEQLTKLEVQATDKDENKEIALGTSKLNYLDPRISAAWCKKWEVPIEKVYNKTQRDKFRWAIDMAEADFRF